MNIRLNIGGVQPFTSSERRQGTNLFSETSERRSEA